MKRLGLVSVVVPSYNRAHVIAETIQSVVDQTYKNWELLIIDDGSTDNSKVLVEEFKDDRIRYIAIEHCGVIGKVRNAGMRNACGEFIAFLDSDDVWLPFKLDYQLSLLKKYPLASFVFGHGEQFGKNATPTPQLESFFSGNVFLPFLFESRFIFYVPTLLFKSEIIERIGWIDESLINAGDIDFFLRMAHEADGIFSNAIVVRIRRDGPSHSQENEQLAYDEYFTMLAKQFSENRLTQKKFDELTSKHHYRLGLWYGDHGNHKRAMKELRKHIQLRPFGVKGWIRWAQACGRAIIK